MPFGLDYPGVESAMRMLRVKNKTGLFCDLRVMERAAVDSLAERPSAGKGGSA